MVARQLRVLMMVVAIVMAVGAIFGAMNTMYAAVSTRTAEIGTLRALGFGPGSVMASFLLESLMLALAGGVVGVILAMPIDGFLDHLRQLRDLLHHGLQLPGHGRDRGRGVGIRRADGIAGGMAAGAHGDASVGGRRAAEGLARAAGIDARAQYP